MHYEIRILNTHQLRTLLCGLGVRTVLSVICQIYQLVLPLTGLFVADILDQFINGRTCFVQTLYRQTTYADIHAALRINSTFVIIQIREIVIRSICFDLVYRVLRLVCQQQRSTGVTQQFAVIERTVPHKK